VHQLCHNGCEDRNKLQRCSTTALLEGIAYHASWTICNSLLRDAYGIGHTSRGTNETLSDMFSICFTNHVDRIACRLASIAWSSNQICCIKVTSRTYLQFRLLGYNQGVHYRTIAMDQPNVHSSSEACDIIPAPHDTRFMDLRKMFFQLKNFCSHYLWSSCSSVSATILSIRGYLGLVQVNKQRCKKCTSNKDGISPFQNSILSGVFFVDRYVIVRDQNSLILQ
jgi:hypothetical protein